jgi:hypothetical protein
MRRASSGSVRVRVVALIIVRDLTEATPGVVEARRGLIAELEIRLARGLS